MSRRQSTCRNSQRKGLTVYQIITERIVDAIESGNALPWRKTWRTKGGIPKNLKSGKAYRSINVFLLAMLGYEIPYFVTFRQAKEMGGQVKKGEKGCPVVFWKWPTEDQKAEAKAKGKKTFPIVRYYTVFNVSQVDGLTHKRLTEYTEAQAEEPKEAEVIEGAEAMIQGWKDACRISNEFERAFYNPLTDSIGMPKAESFESGPAYYCTLFHEITHATGHEKRLGRFPEAEGVACFGSKSYSLEELTAEMGASFLAAEAGIDPSLYLDNSAAYVAGWLKRLKGDSKLVMGAAGKAQKAADFILGHDWSVTG